MRRFLPAATLFLSAGLAGCGAEGGNPAFRASGEVIALSGGDGGAANACATCHGLRGEGDGRLVPRLAGLDAGYLHRQLDDYHNGRREHVEMRAIVRRLSGEDRAKVSAYYAGLPATGASFVRSSKLYEERCASCHGANGEGGGAANPPLAGQSPVYIAAQLKAWRAGKRRGDGMGVMLAISRSLSPEEINLLASHAEAVSPQPRRPSAPAASR
ncbi:c-type cytochrome [Novosphingobium sp. FGD1]|uniref:C-type cytochrome n=1 Tax=Novosphingobium silvae TaxID=2692619 RepID=A0A7X4GIE3_9SPHN|nr:c-type cytochrome [Novosphingobium silvae]MYL99225.1 c-type cytochrome [Novosphingobium silvae]